MPIATGNSSAPNDYEFMKYRGPTNGNSTAYPSYSEIEFGTGKNGFEPSEYKNAFEPSTSTSAYYEQPSSWLHGTDFNSMAGDLFSSKNKNENSFGNLSLNLDQIKIVKKGNSLCLIFYNIYVFRVIKLWKMF